MGKSSVSVLKRPNTLMVNLFSRVAHGARSRRFRTVVVGESGFNTQERSKSTVVARTSPLTNEMMPAPVVVTRTVPFDASQFVMRKTPPLPVFTSRVCPPRSSRVGV